MTNWVIHAKPTDYYAFEVSFKLVIDRFNIEKYSSNFGTQGPIEPVSQGGDYRVTSCL